MQQLEFKIVAKSLARLTLLQYAASKSTILFTHNQLDAIKQASSLGM